MIAEKLLKNGLKALNNYEEGMLCFWLIAEYSYLISPFSVLSSPKPKCRLLQMCSPFQIQDGFKFKECKWEKNLAVHRYSSKFKKQMLWYNPDY